VVGLGEGARPSLMGEDLRKGLSPPQFFFDFRTQKWCNLVHSGCNFYSSLSDVTMARSERDCPLCTLQFLENEGAAKASERARHTLASM